MPRPPRLDDRPRRLARASATTPPRRRTPANPLYLLGAGALLSAAACGKPGASDAFDGDASSSASPGSLVDAAVSPGSTPPPGSASGSPGDDAGITIVLGDGSTANAPLCAAGGTGWRCAVNTSCATPTTITGTVYDPAGKNPIYNAVVFVPNDVKKLPVITPGTSSCNSCDATIGDYVAATKTDAAGAFTLQRVPTGHGVPLAVQIGKWRRVVTIDTADCATTAAPAEATRLPRSRAEGDMPQMALLTGGLDDLGCFLTNVGIDPAEYASPHSGGRLDIYQGVNAPLGLAVGTGPGLTNGAAGNCTTASCPLWSTRQALESYDIVLLACEGSEFNQTKPASAMTAMHDWLGEGGKVFATHFHYTWFKNGPPDFQGVATWLGSSVGLGIGNFSIDTSFFKGQVLHDWLQNTGALNGGTLPLNGVATSVSTVNAPTLRWIYDGNTSPNDTKYLSFGTPIGGIDGGNEGPAYCGKAVFTDLHAGGAPSGDLPGSCARADLTPQEKALEFLFFDLSACVSNDGQEPPPPPPPLVQ